MAQLVLILVVWACATLNGEIPYQELKTKLDQALGENSRKVGTDQNIATLGKLYLDRLSELRTEFMDQGSLDGVQEVEDEISRFKDSGDSPTQFSSLQQLARYQRIYADEIKRIQAEERVGALQFYKVYGDGLLEREEELVRKGFIEEAIEVRGERDRVKKLIKRLSKGRVDPRTIRPEDVFNRPEEMENADSPEDDQVTIKDKANLSNEAFNGLKARFEKTLEVHWRDVAADEKKLYNQYIEELKVRKFHYQEQGSLDGVLALQVAAKNFEEKGTIPKSDTELRHLLFLQRSFSQDIKELKSADRKRLLSIHRQYSDELGALERSLVKQHLIDEAIVVRNERDRVTQSVERQTKSDLILNVFEAKKSSEEE